MKELSEIGPYDSIEQPNKAWFSAIKFCGAPRIFPKKVPFIRIFYNGFDTNDFER